MTETNILYIWSICWIGVNILAFFMIFIDKTLAKIRFNKNRISELTLLVPVLWGGFPGTLIGMILCNHKTSLRKKKFKLMLVIFAILYYAISPKMFAHFLGTNVQKYQFQPYLTYLHLFYDGQNLSEDV